MNILLLGHREIASNLALSLIAGALPEHRFTVMLSGGDAGPHEMPVALRALAAFEQALCSKLPPPLRSFEALASGVVRELPRPNSAEGLRAMADIAPDLAISVRYRRILGDAAIAIPAHGVLNLHSGLLPGYRGMMATFWAMLNDEAVIGSTLHYIVDRGIDTGPVVGRAAIRVDRRRSYLANVLALYGPGCDMVIEAVRRIGRGDTVGRAPQESGGAYYSMPGEADLARFARAGLRLFDGTERVGPPQPLDSATPDRVGPP